MNVGTRHKAPRVFPEGPGMSALPSGASYAPPPSCPPLAAPAIVAQPLAAVARLCLLTMKPASCCLLLSGWLGVAGRGTTHLLARDRRRRRLDTAERHYRGTLCAHTKPRQKQAAVRMRSAALRRSLPYHRQSALVGAMPLPPRYDYTRLIVQHIHLFSIHYKPAVYTSPAIHSHERPRDT